MKFRDNGNSMDTCFQFVSEDDSEGLTIRIKVYWKTLAYIQSESVMKALGMNLKGIFYPSIRMGVTLRESQDYGTTRIEITYTATKIAGENKLLHPQFPEEARMDLNKAYISLMHVADICWHIPLWQLWDKFIEVAREN